MPDTENLDDLRSTSGENSDSAPDVMSLRATAGVDEVVTDSATARRIAQHVAADRLDRFTPDETTIDIIAALARGETRLATAELLRISESTVRRKMACAREAWGVDTNTEVIVTAVRVGLI